MKKYFMIKFLLLNLYALLQLFYIQNCHDIMNKFIVGQWSMVIVNGGIVVQTLRMAAKHHLSESFRIVILVFLILVSSVYGIFIYGFWNRGMILVSYVLSIYVSFMVLVALFVPREEIKENLSIQDIR